ncbi:MAG: DUF2281 domain-containing protein [Cyclobacteriaceae bacterium]
MSDTQLIEQIKALPEDLKKKVKVFVSQLGTEKQRVSNESKKRPFGYAKGSFKINDDFDEPLEDFQEYMK